MEKEFQDGHKELANTFNKRMKELEEKKLLNIEDVSDGYHTFKELYDYRLAYNALLFNSWSSQRKYNVYKSKKHNDGKECFGGGWFIVVALTDDGIIDNHYELKYWDLFNIPETERCPVPFDGHTPKDVSDILFKLLENKQS